MGAITLREEFHKLIDSIEDESRLFQYFHLIKDEKNGEIDISKELTPEQANRLEQSITQIDNGNYHTQEQFNQFTAGWRTKLSTPKIS